MKISHHPSDETLSAYAAGALDEGSAFVVAAHLALCAECREAARDFECIGGALLADAEPERLDRAIAAGSLQELAPAPARAAAQALQTVRTGESHVDDLLAVYGHGRWKWRGFGVQSADVNVPVEDGVRVFLLKAAPGARMPQHSHSGVELTLVLKGAFDHAYGHFGPGDIEEADGSVDHRPVVDKSSECICLVAMSGRLELPGLAGKLLQPFIRL